MNLKRSILLRVSDLFARDCLTVSRICDPVTCASIMSIACNEECLFKSAYSNRKLVAIRQLEYLHKFSLERFPRLHLVYMEVISLHNYSKFLATATKKFKVSCPNNDSVTKLKSGRPPHLCLRTSPQEQVTWRHTS